MATPAGYWFISCNYSGSMIRTTLICAAILSAAAISLAGCGSSDPAAPTDYKVEAFSWPQIAKHKPVEGYVESAWHDPAYSYVVLAVDTRSSDETASPQASAQLARIQTTKLSGYKERGVKWIRLSGRPALRWAFDLGNRAHIEYFFEECGISFVVRGTSGLPGFSSISETFRAIATTIKTACSE
jgi:hypothetical protein